MIKHCQIPYFEASVMYNHLGHNGIHVFMIFTRQLSGAYYSSPALHSVLVVIRARVCYVHFKIVLEIYM